MGKFIYSDNTKIDIEDRALAHLQVVIGSKLRRGESFHFTWNEDESVGGGRTSVWLDRSVPLSYRFYGSRRPALNPGWIDVLMHAANSPLGLMLVPEPAGPPATESNMEVS